MKFILGTKEKMTQIFSEEGKIIPATIIKAGPVKVTQVKTKEKDGYEAVQVGFGTKKKISQPLKGHLKDLGNFRWLKEFKIDGQSSEFKVGDEIKVDVFQQGDKVKIVGISKGKGFQGVVKRHGFHGSDASHGTKDRLRAPGSIGATHPQHVPKGRKMAGHTGLKRITLKNVEVVKVDKENNLIYLKGAIPGNRGSLVLIEAK
ncbi:MAG TPA: 50S ribosomal protein L3 [Candidatus Paceibacterota bacterium]|nr:50S ribosomal protein L3 [Candidatus Paceibacterota bacterium]